MNRIRRAVQTMRAARTFQQGVIAPEEEVSAQETLEQYYEQDPSNPRREEVPNPIPYKEVAERILKSWDALDDQSNKIKTPLQGVSKHNWPKWIVEKKKFVTMDGVHDLKSVVESILKVGFWFRNDQHISAKDSSVTFDESTARESVQIFLTQWEKTEGENLLMERYNALAGRDQFLIKSEKIRMYLGNYKAYKSVRFVPKLEIEEPAATADTVIYKLHIDTNNYTTHSWRAMDGVAAPPAAAMLDSLVSGFRAEAAFHITNGSHQDDGVSRWRELNGETDAQIWGESSITEDSRNIEVFTQFKVNTSTSASKHVVGSESGTKDKHTQALERYVSSNAHQRLVNHFISVLYGMGDGTLATAADVVANSGRVHKLFTRHALSCANIAKAVGKLRASVNRVLDVAVIPAGIRSVGMSVLKGLHYLDAKLSDLGVSNSIHGGYQLAQQCAANNIPAPRKAFTSTMQRTIETSRYMMQGMSEHAAAFNEAPLGWGQFNVADMRMTIMPGIKERGSGAENTPRPVLDTLKERLIADNSETVFALDDSWIEGNGSTWNDNKETDSFEYFQQKLGENMRADMGPIDPDNNIEEQTSFIVTHSRQMKSWFGAFAGGSKPENNETWRFEYVRIPGQIRDEFVLISQPPANDDAEPALWRVGGYAGFKGRKADKMDVAPLERAGAITQQNVAEPMCKRCDSPFLSWYVRTGL